MYRIINIQIDGFIGQSDSLSFPVDGEVNFFIGRNGTGKTRLMNLLNSALSADLFNLMRIQFSKIEFKMGRSGERSRPYIRITKHIAEDQEPLLLFEIAMSARSKAQTFKFDASDLHDRWYRPSFAFHMKRRFVSDEENSLQALKVAMSNLVQLSWISVHRAASESPKEGERKFESSVDRKLDQVARDFGVYFSTLDKNAADETDRFQQIYLLSLISTASFEQLSSLQAVNAEDEKLAIRGMFAEFKIKSNVYSKKLDLFSNRMAKALANYKPQGPMNGDDFLVLTDTVRIHDVVGEWHKLLQKRAAIYAPKNDFVSIVNDMFYRKKLEINEGNQPVFRNDAGDVVDIDNLSSGEKQLFILLGETLLQRQRSCVFMADEPELSLHIDWQERLVPSLRRINPNAQIVFATHSPDIVGAFTKNAINLEKIL